MIHHVMYVNFACVMLRCSTMLIILLPFSALYKYQAKPHHPTDLQHIPQHPNFFLHGRAKAPSRALILVWEHNKRAAPIDVWSWRLRYTSPRFPRCTCFSILTSSSSCLSASALVSSYVSADVFHFINEDVCVDLFLPVAVLARR